MFKKNTTYQKFNNMFDTESRTLTSRRHIAFTGHGKSRLSKVVHYYDIPTCGIDCDCETIQDREQDNVKSTPNLKLKLPIPKSMQKKTYPVLVVHKKSKKPCNVL